MKLKLRKPAWSEKRESIRLELECPASFRRVETKWVFLKKTGTEMPCLMLKPSMNGMRLSTEAPIPPGSNLDIEVYMQKLGYNKTYVLRGQVMWSDFSGKTHRYEQGVRIIHGGADTRNWQKFILEQLRGSDRNPKLHSFSG